MIVLDLEKAFDTVWYQGLIFKLHKFNLPSYLIKIIQNYLKGRKFLVRLQQYANILAEFFDRWKLKVNAQKTDLIIFSRKQKKEKIPDFRLQNQPVEIKTNVKYLGVILNTKLNYHAHVENTKKNVHKIIGVLFCLIRRNSSLSIRNKIIIYNMIIKAAMLYALPVWSNTNTTNILKLQKLQNKCLRMITNAKCRDRNADIHCKLKIPPIEKIIYDRTRSFYKTQINNISEMQEARILSREEAPFKMKYKMPCHILMDK